MLSELRGLSLSFAFLAIILGFAMCTFRFAGSFDVTVIAFITFFFVYGVVLRYRDELPAKDLFTASLVPPFVAVAYVVVAARRLGCDAITGGVAAPTLDYLAEIFLYGTVLTLMGVGASTVVRRVARWYDSPTFLNFMARQARRVEAIGKLMDRISGMSTLAAILKRLKGGGE